MDERLIKLDHFVVKSNSLICANYELSIQEQRIILMLASLVKPEDEEFFKYKLKIKDFIDIIGTTNKGTYTDISKLTKGLMKKVFEIKNEKKNTLLQIAWLSCAYYNYGEGFMTLGFSPHLKPYLLQLKTLYTKYKLKNILKLKSKYSIRIYEILKCNAFKKQTNIDIDELKKMTGGTVYKNNSDFKKRVLIPSQCEVNKYTDIYFEYSEIKIGSKIVAISFSIKNKEIESDVNIEYDEEELLVEIKHKIQKTTGSIIKLAKVKELLEEKGKDLIYSYINNYHKFKVNKHNPAGFLIKAIEEEWPIPDEEINEYNTNKPVQSTNFEQRKYDDEYFESLYDNEREI